MKPEEKKKQALPGETEKEKPRFESAYSGRAEELYNRLQSRKPFTYDINTDALYRQYRDQYAAEGQLAMLDAMGAAQTMTGGYGNSYAQTAGQQAYQSYLGRLNDKIPQLYAQALEQYRLEGEDLKDRYQQARDLEQRDYSRYRDALEDRRKEEAALQSQKEDAYNREYQQYLQSYKVSQDSLNWVMKLMEDFGYEPTEQELQSLGLTESQIRLLLKGG